ncbi:MAG: hypothetical protein Q9174_006372 [Haloplaca sp. 1 TL-2023]
MTEEPVTKLVCSHEDLRAGSNSNNNVSKAAQPPIVGAATTPPRPRFKGITGLRKAKSKGEQQWALSDVHSKLRHDHRRDSGLAPSSSTARDSRTTLSTEAGSSRSLQNSPSLPQLTTTEDRAVSGPTNEKTWDAPQNSQQQSLEPAQQGPFVGLVTEIPTGRFDDLSLPGQVDFSARGSMLIGGKKANHINGLLRKSTVRSRNPSVHLSPPDTTTSRRLLSPDEEMLSSQVRLKYERIPNRNPETIDGSLSTNLEPGQSETSGVNPQSRINSTASTLQETANGNADLDDHIQVPKDTPREISLQLKDDKDLAGGIEDWENLNGGDVDRYGFIVPAAPSRGSSMSPTRKEPSDPPKIQRVSTVLQIASEAPRRRRSRLGRGPTSASSPSRSFSAASGKRPDSRNSRPPSAQSSDRGTLNSKPYNLRSGIHRPPRSRDRKHLREAGDMLTLPPGLANIAEDQEDSRAAEDLRHREREREEKWRKMARVVNQDNHRGGGMVFDFDTKSPKVIERTWKGIPDRWRATAWHAFLSASAKKRKGMQSDEELKLQFHKLLEQASPDDVQIDIDVPRTINRHIMFRRRYRGGQRLLFRVLHCLSIHFPDTGYVQGMAALAATLLCYFDEEMTFVMLVRLWQLRGLERLYQSGFEGLMQALEEFEKGWLAGGEVANKLKPDR